MCWSSSKSRKSRERCKPQVFERRGRKGFAEDAEKAMILSFHSAISAHSLRPLRSVGTLASQPSHAKEISHTQPRVQGRRSDPARSDGADRARVEDPRGGMVTIQAVEVTPDYAHAKVFFSVLVGDPQECEDALNQAAGFLRNGLFKRLRIHRADSALPVRPHHRACRRPERPDRQGGLVARKRRLIVNAPRTRVQRRPVHGVLLLDKPLGLTSNAALQRAKWLLRAEKAGHTGTLDPLATGVLPLCFGAATKFSQLQLDADKTYEATVRLGVRTTTGDAEGEVIQERPVPAIDADRVAQVARQFTGPLRQVPPMHSALKKDGKALYEYARAGQEVEREARDVVVHELRLDLPDATSALRLVAKVQQGNLHPHARRSDRRSPGLRRSPDLAAAHCHGALRGRAMRHAGSPGGHDRGAAPGLPEAGGLAAAGA